MRRTGWQVDVKHSFTFKRVLFLTSSQLERAFEQFIEPLERFRRDQVYTGDIVGIAVLTAVVDAVLVLLTSNIYSFPPLFTIPDWRREGAQKEVREADGQVLR